MRKILVVLVTSFISLFAFSQDFSNKGKDFWVGYGYHAIMSNGSNAQDMFLYFATDQPTTITVTIPGLGWTRTYTSGAGNNIITSDAMPKAGVNDARLTTESTVGESKGIHITADHPIVAYAHIFNMSASGATILYPTPTLGKEYYSVNYANNSNATVSNCWFYVVATDPGTTVVEITPSQSTLTHAANVPFTVNLTQGQIFNIMGTYAGSGSGVDLTGSKIKSIASGTESCKRIAVFSGSGRITISCDGSTPSSDNYMVQALPKTTWGKNYLTLPTAGYGSGAVITPLATNIYRVCVQDPATQVFIDGVLTTLPLQGNFYYEIAASAVKHSITADNPIMVAQYLPSTGTCGNASGDGDPEVIYLSPIEQSISAVTWNACNKFAIKPNKHYINVIIPNGGTAISSFKLDGVPVPAISFSVHPQNANYSTLILNVASSTVGSGLSHTVTSDSGFNAIAYGYGPTESYGYNAGTNVKDLNQKLEVSTPYGVETSPSVCVGATTTFKVYFPIPATPTSNFDSIHWSINTTTAVSPNNFPISIINPTIDSTNIRNGKPVNWYSLPSTYSFNTPGTYTVTLTTYKSTNEGCGTSQDFDFQVEVDPPPTTDFLWFNPGCPSESVAFNDQTTSIKPTYQWSWDFGDPASGAANNTSALKNPSHIFSGPGTYHVKYTNITTPGCVSSITHDVIVPDLPTATISGTAGVCLNGAAPTLTITGIAGAAPYDFTYTINGGAPITVTSDATGIYTLTVPTTVTGPFVYTLTAVKNHSSTVCTNNVSGQSATITVTPLPTATASASPSIVCLNGTPPTVTFTGASGVAPYTFNYTINGVAQTPIVSNGAGVATVPAPTNASGSFIYSITSVSNAGALSCSQTLSNVSATVTVNALPVATISASTNAVCLNSASPTVTFTGTGGTAPYTFNYTLNGVAQTAVVSNNAGIYTITVPTNATGPFTYAITSVQEGSSNLCVQPTVTGQQVTVTVNPLPTAAITGTTIVCLNAPSPMVTFTGTGGTAPYTFNYTINGIAQTPVVSNGAGVATINAATNVAGPFIYAITLITDGSSTACSQSYTATALNVTVNVKQLPSGTMSGTSAVCLNGTSPNITLTGTGGIAPYTFTYSINGVTQPTVISDAAGVYTIAVPTNIATTYTYALVNVQEGSANACIQTGIAGQQATVTVNPLPTATIAVSTPTVCLNGTATITFTGSAATAPYTFSYTINGVPQTPVVSNASGIASVSVVTSVANTFTYALTSVKDGTPTACVQSQTGTATIIVNPLPSPNFSFSTPTCNTRSVSFTDNSVPNVGTLTGWAWNFGDGSPVDNTQNPTHTYTNAGTFTVSLTVSTNNGCSNAVPFTKSVTVNERPHTDFNVPTLACVSDIVTFTDNSTFGTGTANPGAYKWIFGDLASGAANTQLAKDGTHQFSAGGTYTVMHISGSLAGCLDTISHPITISSAAVADFSVANAAALCVNDTVAITNLSTIAVGNITKLEIYWDYSGAPTTAITDNAPVLNAVYKHKYPNFQTPANKTYTVLVRAFSGLTCTNDKIRTVTVNAVPKVQFNAMPDVCYDATPFQITQASETGGVAGTGTYTGAGVSPTGLFSPKVAGIGTHAIKYTFTSIAGCVDSMSSNIKVLDTASAKFSYVTPLCDGNAVVFKDESIAPAGVILGPTVCNMGDGAIINVAPGGTFTHTYATWGTYTVTMSAKSTYGCISTPYTQQVTVHAIPQPVFAFNQTSVCLPNAAVSFTNTSSVADNSGITYQWDFGDPTSGLSNTSTAKTPPAHSYSGVGPYTVKLVVIGATGTNGSCNATVSHIVNFIHPQPKAAFVFDKPTICIGDNVTVTDKTNGLDGTVQQWFWNFGDNIKASTNQVQHLYTAAQTYNVSLYIINSQGCNSDTLTQPFVVNPYPVVDAGPDRVVLEGGSVTMQPVVSGNDLQYLWSPATYLNDVALATPTANIILNDITYTLTVTGRGGCTAPSDNLFIKVLKAPKIPNTFTPNNDGINDVWAIDYLSTYPNCRVQVFTRAGQSVFESRGYKTPWDGTIKGKPLPFDTYYYIIEPGNGRAPITGYITIVK